MSKLTSTASVCQSVEFYGLKVHVGHDKHGFGKAIFEDFGFTFEQGEPDICWQCPPSSETGMAIIAAIRPAKQGFVKPPVPKERRLVRKANRLLRTAARLEALLDADRLANLSWV
jgi:hypothetical protein